MNKKLKKTYLLTVCVSIIYITLISCIINDCRQVTQDYVDKYKLHIERISNLEDSPLTLAEEFMQAEYDKHWDSLKGCWGKEDLIGGYELGSYIVPGRYATCFYRNNRKEYNSDEFPEGINTLILCNAYVNDEAEHDKTIVIGFFYNGNNRGIGGHIEYHGDNPPERVYFNITPIGDEYVADKANLEELTGLTVEEIVETAELNRKGFEDLMYAMKEHELEESKNDLNSNLKYLYTIATLLIVAFLSLWITVLVAFFESITKKKTVSTPIERDKHEDKQKT